MIIGTFSYDPKTDSYSGEITTLSLHRADVHLRPNQKSGEKEPDYRVVHEGASGAVEFGAAWKRESERGRAFLSIVLDDPALPSSLSAALFPGENGQTARLAWTRPAAPTATKPKAARSGKPRAKAPSP